MESNRKHKSLPKNIWKQANVRLLPSAAFSIAGATLSSIYGNVRSGNFDHKLVALLGVIIFVLFAAAFLNVLTGTLHRLLAHYHMSTGRRAAIQFGMRIIGYTLLFLITLALLGIPIGNLLLSGAAVGIILGVAAQQALANFFASIVLITSHPFSVGDHVTFNSGALGGTYDGFINDIGLTHTRLRDEAGSIVMLPNATLLSGATIIVNNNVVD